MERYGSCQMNNTEIAKSLDQFLNKTLSENVVPTKRGNTILLGNFKIKKKQTSYKIIPIGSKQAVCQTQSLLGALAFAKTQSLGQNRRQLIEELDYQYSKYQNDCDHYQYTIKASDDQTLKHAVYARYDLVKTKLENTRQRLEKILYY